MLNDLRAVIRSLARSPANTTLAIASLALGVAAATTVCTLFDAAMLRTRYPDADRLVELGNSMPALLVPAIAERWSQESRQAERFGFYRTTGFQSMTDRGERYPERPGGAIQISPGVLRMLGGETVLGRAFTDGDGEPGATPVVMLSHEYWRKRFAADPSVIGRSIRVDDTEYTVIGVTRPEFMLVQATVKLFLPLSERHIPNRTMGVQVVAKVAPGASRASLAAELETIVVRDPSLVAIVDQNGGDTKAIKVSTRDIDWIAHEWANEAFRPAIGAALFLLLIACANVGGLFVTRGMARQKELLVRSALGASRSRLARAAAAEAGLVCLVGGALGLLLTALSLSSARSLMGVAELTPEVSIDFRALLIAIGLVALAALLASFWPMWFSSRTNPADGLRSTSAGTTQGRFGVLAQRILVVSQVAASFLLVTGAGLFTKSITRTLFFDPGFETKHLIQAGFYYRALDALDRMPSDFEETYRRIGQLPGVANVATVAFISQKVSITETGLELSYPFGDPWGPAFSVTPNYLETIGVPLLAGRNLTIADIQPQPTAAVINEDAARAWWPAAHGHVLGKQVRIGRRDSTGAVVTVVGIAGSFRSGVEYENPTPRQGGLFVAGSPSQLGGLASVLVRTRGDPGPTLEALDRMSSTQRVSIDKPATVAGHFKYTASVHSGNAYVMNVVAGIGVFLAAVGIVGVVAQSIVRRTREIGIRIAIGASGVRLIRAIVRDGLMQATLGTALGIALSAGLTRFLRSLLLEVDPLDPAIFVGAAVVMTVVIGLACYLPGRRGTKIEPMVVLRSE